MSAEEFDALKWDIAENGLREPIWTYQNQIIDGRNRYQACVFLGVQPDYREWDGEGSLVMFVVSLNLKRRHLTSSQKATVSLEVETQLAEEAKQKEQTRKTTFEKFQKSDLPPVHAAKQAAVITGTNQHYVNDAKKIQKDAPDLFVRVHNGEMRIPEAKREMKSRQSAEIRTQAAAEIKETNTSIIVGDFWQNADKVADNSLSLIFTDPPYSKDAEKSFPHLADFAARKLAPGGSILFYLGHLQLPAAFKAFDGKLRHWWTCACVHTEKALMTYYGVRAGWKPMLWFVKEARYDVQNIVIDTMRGPKEKQFHDWQQREEDAQYWIEQLCPIDGIVCDPYLGGGTTAAAAQKLNRKWIAFEIDPETARIASGRLEKEK